MLKTRTGIIVALVFAFLLGSVTKTRVDAQGPRERDCVTQYERFAIWSWDQLDACVQETNQDPFWRRLGTRARCNIEYGSRVAQSITDYATCMTFR